jgi:hypothetical protein
MFTEINQHRDLVKTPVARKKTIKIARTWDVHHPKKIDHLKIV